MSRTLCLSPGIAHRIVAASLGITYSISDGECCSVCIHWTLRAQVLTGGVACNSVVRQRLESESAKHGVRFVCPPARLCTDNAAMIAWTGLQKWHLGHQDPLSIDYSDRWPVGAKASWPEQTEPAEGQSTKDAEETLTDPLP